MQFRRIEPADSIKHLIECYWIIEDDNTEIVTQKIIPDGFPEIIFHYGDSYRILIDKMWEVQSKFLLAGQITKYFYLENTGKTAALGIKLKPTALTHLFEISMKACVDKVVSLEKYPLQELEIMQSILASTSDYKKVIYQLNNFFEELAKAKSHNKVAVDNAVNMIFRKNGMVTIPELCAVAYLGERQLLNQFRYYVGLSPKLYARIARLSYIFKLVQKNKDRWCSLAYEAAFFDHAHFIKDFKSFIGEKPSKYAFDEKNMANFFLSPPVPEIL